MSTLITRGRGRLRRAGRTRRPGRRLATMVPATTGRPGFRMPRLGRPRFGRSRGGRPRFGGRWWPAVVLGVLGLGAGAGILGGPVAAGLAGVYGGGLVVVAMRHRRATRQNRAVAATLDTVAEMAAELRAGAAPSVVVEAAGPVLAGTPTEQAAVLAACAVSERVGAPLADVLDRVEDTLRRANRLRLSVGAHRAGTRATALLLGVLPLGGIAVGYAVGADPVHQLLHTAVGAACAGAACVLQVAGFVWTERLSTVDI